MMDLLGKAAFHLMFRDRKKKIAQFLRTITPDSVLSDLRTCLVHEGKGITSVTPQAVFDASSIRDSPQEQPYWSKKSFQNHLARTHPDATIPDTAIDALWSCFCFFAYHPFPLPGAESRKLELPGFERAFILLILQGTSVLGLVSDDFGHSWGRFDEPCNCRLRTNRIFRSISLVDLPSSSEPYVTGFDTLVIDDVIDATLPIFPSHPKLHPSLEQLKPVAERLLEGRTNQYQTKTNDLTALLSLMMRVRVNKSTWGRDIYYGSLEESSPEQEALAKSLAHSLSSNPGDEYLAPDSVLRAFEILPNLEQSFHQLWAVLFQPSPSSAEKPTAQVTEPSPDASMDGILRAASLFIPPFQAHRRSEVARKVKAITFHKSYDSLSHDLTDRFDLGRILPQALHDDPSGRAQLVLFLGHQAPESTPVVVGAFFPRGTQSPAATEGQAPGKIKPSRIARPRLLFELQPRFDLWRWNGSVSSAQASDRTTGHPEHPNGIGDLNGSKVGVEIDTGTGQTTFVRGAVPAADDQIPSRYEEVTARWAHDGAENTDGDPQERKTIFTATRLVVCGVEGGPDYEYPAWG